MRTPLRWLSFCLFVACLLACTPKRNVTASPEVLRYAQIDEPDGLNPLTSHFAWMANIRELVFSGLLTTTNGTDLAPDLAREVPTIANGGISADRRTITYRLRSARWQDGAAVTARDVAFTFSAVMNRRNAVASRRGYDQILNLKVVDNRTVVIRLRTPLAPILALFFGPDSNYPVLPAHLLAQYPEMNDVPYNQRPIGSGPFKLLRWVRGDRITFTRNDLYFRGRPKLRQLVFKVIPNQNAIAIAVQTGELDAWFGADPVAIQEIGHDSRTRIQRFRGKDIAIIGINVRDPILSDARVRRAVERALDVPYLVHVASHSVYRAFAGTSPPDRKIAANLLEEAGWHLGPDGLRHRKGKTLEVELGYNRAREIAGVVAAIFQQQERTVGIAVNLKRYTTIQVLGSPSNPGILGLGHYQMYFGWDARGVDPDVYGTFGCDQFPPRGNNTTFWCDTRASEALKDARATFDPARRARDYAVFERALRSQVPEIMLYQGDSATLSSPRFSYVQRQPWNWEMH